MPTTVHKFTLPNGVRVVCEPVTHIQSVAIGVWCQSGSRMESESEGGISHLIEHMLFKGTKNRTAEQIAQSIEGCGGHLNAFTDRELTCYYARVLSDDLDNAVETLSDMYVNSLIDPKELELEKGVVQEEIRKYEDSPEDHIHDLHARKRWGGHPLGRPIIGTHESVGSFTQAILNGFMGRRYTGGNTLVCAAGDLDPEALRSSVEKNLGSLNGASDDPPAAKPASKTGENLIPKDVEQVHFCIGGDSVVITDERRFTASVLDAILGGSMSSRLFQEVREKRGLVYAIGSYTALYKEAGAFTIYGGTNPKKFDELRQVVAVELAKVRDDEIPDGELQRAKKMMAGNAVLSLEGMSARMHRIARNEMVHGREIPIEETLEKIDGVTTAEIREMACEFLAEEQLTTTAIGPF
ncbi:MAG: M16 family metallopeptidase [Fimbriimonadales bacterium]